MLENSKISIKKLQNVSTYILNRYPTLTSSFCMLFSIDDLRQEHFPSEIVIHKQKFIW